VKLLAELQKQVGAMDDIRRAWFTSFNTDIEFVEAFVLPAVLGAPTPRNRLEYEALQQGLTRQGIDFAVFCDPRFLETGRIKRTCIPVHGVRPQRTEGRFSEKSLFHPKVIYLEDRNGKRVVGAGSANLTVSGWGRNLETFQFFEVKGYANYREIRGFFESVFHAADVPFAMEQRPRFLETGERWQFVHSYQENASFPERLLAGEDDADLAVWSPYLPRDLRAHIARLEGAADVERLRVHLVADRSAQGRRVRTPWSEELSQLQREGRLKFRRNPAEMHPEMELCHAKVWKVGRKLAVGSWNFTGPGSNSLRDGEGEWDPCNNVEAGFIIDDRHSWEEACGAVFKVGPDECASEELLAKEGLKVAPLPPFDLHVTFDWHALAYDFGGEWLEGRPTDTYSVLLPGLPAPVPLLWKRDRTPQPPGLLDVDDKALLRDRVFKVLEQDKVVQRGIVSEVNAASRRAQHFDSLGDLFDAILQGNDVRELDTLEFRIPLDTDTFADDAQHEDVEGHDAEDGDGAMPPRIGYFRLFQSVHAYAEKLDGLAKLQALDQHVFLLPGCLLEIADKVRKELRTPGSETFHWFLANEVRWLCERASAKRAKLAWGYRANEPGYEPVPLSRWKKLTLILPADPPVDAAYVSHVRQQWGQHA
jgi:hypothetical protein